MRDPAAARRKIDEMNERDERERLRARTRAGLNGLETPSDDYTASVSAT